MKIFFHGNNFLVFLFLFFFFSNNFVFSLESSPASTACASTLTATPITQIVIVGVGDVVRKYYSPAFSSLKKRFGGTHNFQVTFIDSSKYWKGNAQLEEKMKGVIALVREWGAEYLDLDTPADKIKIDDLRPNHVVVATPDFAHVDTARTWLQHKNPPQHIFVEKPLDTNIKKARALLGELDHHDARVLTLDHYRARLLPTEYQLKLISDLLGGGVASFKYYFLEDKSGADPSFTPSAPRDGAIESEIRTKALNSGMVMDGVPHMFPLLEYFGKISSVRIMSVQAAQYTGVDGDLNKRTEIKGETYAHIHFKFERRLKISNAGSEMAPMGFADGELFVGKGIKGVRALGTEYDHNTKLLEVVGVNGNRVRFDLRSSSANGNHATATLFRGDHEEVRFDLNEKPYEVFFEKIITGSFLQDRVALFAEDGERMLEIMDRAVSPIIDTAILPVYPGGVKGRREAPYVEDLNLPYLYGKEAN